MSWSKRERRWWLAAFVWIVLIYSTLYFVRGPVEFLRERNLLRLTVGALFAGSAAGIALYLWRRRIGLREGGILLGFSVLFGAVVMLAKLPEEKLHFLEYGLLGALVYHAFRERALRRRSGRLVAVLLAILVAGLAGWGDEGIQDLLPNRYYDVRDIVWNFLGSTLVILALYAADAVRPPDRPPNRAP